MKSKKKSKKNTDGAIYYTGKVPMRFRNHIPPNYIWSDTSFQVMAHELLHMNAPMQNLGYYIQRTGARYLLPKRSPIQRRSPLPAPRRSPIRSPIRRPLFQQQKVSPEFNRAINDFLRYKAQLKEKKNK
jgi:hypothetical protein